MAALGSKMRTIEGGRLMFFCPGCACAHAVGVEPPAKVIWSWDKNIEFPTFSPSLLVSWTQNLVTHTEARRLLAANQPIPHKDVRCHSFINGGVFEYLADCTHDLRSQKVPMPSWPWGVEA